MDAVQAEIEAALTGGHNMIITGQAGTGKTYIIKGILKKLLSMGKTVKILATTGIASTMLPNASTVHSFFGLLDGRFTSTQLITKINNDDNYHEIKERIIKTDVLIIDEISLMSRKIFEQIEEVSRVIRKDSIIFGGMQVVLSGDFLQLKPVPDTAYDDNGEYIIQSDKFIFHKFVLEKVHRQSEGTLIQTVHELSRGEVSPQTEQFLKRMRRQLPPGEVPVKIFATNYDVDKYNADKLLELSGSDRIFRAVDSGDTKHLSKCHIPQFLHLKEHAPVMLLVNLSAKLVNGLCGIVKEMKPGSVDIYFESIDRTVTINQYRFSVFSREKGMDVAVRMQLPLKLSFAITTHKAQGLTLKRVEIDCRHMRNPGQIGVAVGRAREMKGLRVLNFSKHLVKRHSCKIYDFYETEPLPLKDNLSCCRIQTEEKAEVNTVTEQDFDTGDDSDNECNVNEDEQNTNDLLRDIETVEIVDTLYSEWEDEAPVLNHPLPSDVDIHNILAELKYEEVITKQQEQLNDTLSMLGKSPHLKQFANQIHNKLYSLFVETIPQNAPIENKHTTALYKKFTLFLSCEDYYKLVKSLFCLKEPTRTHYRTAFGIVQKIRATIINKASEPILMKAREEAKTKVKTTKDSKGSKAKIRYIGGWCVATLRYRKKVNVTRNLYRQSMRHQIKIWDAEMRLLEQLSAKEEITDSLGDKDTLIEIVRKQNIQSGLTILSEKAFGFFVNLDKYILTLESFENLNLHGKEFYSFIFSELKNNKELNEEWKSLFSDEDEFTKNDYCDSIDSMLEEVFTKFLKMSSSQFRQDYKRELKIQKEEAHRKQIRMKDSKKEIQNQRIETIIKDESALKQKSHLRLKSEIVGNESFLEQFTNDSLISLCGAYDVQVSKKLKKKELANLLTQALMVSDKMPYPERMTMSSLSMDTVTFVQRKKRQHKLVRDTGKGKKKQKTLVGEDSSFPCGICKKHCEVDCVCCDLCDNWYHFICLQVTGDEDEFKNDWFCNICKNY